MKHTRKNTYLTQRVQSFKRDCPGPTKLVSGVQKEGFREEFRKCSCQSRIVDHKLELAMMKAGWEDREKNPYTDLQSR